MMNKISFMLPLSEYLSKFQIIQNGKLAKSLSINFTRIFK